MAVAALLTWRLPSGPLRRFCGALLAVDALSTVLFLAYAAVGVDSLSDYYIGYFYWSAPLLVVLVIALAVTGLLPGRVAAVAAVVRRGRRRGGVRRRPAHPVRPGPRRPGDARHHRLG